MKIDNWIWFDNKNEWWLVVEQKELNYYTDMYEAWQTKQPVVIGREVKWSAWWWLVKTWWLFDINTNWDINITWVWFTPKLIKFSAIYSDWASSAMSVWHYCNWVNNSVSSYEDATDYSQNSRCFRLWWTNWLWKVTAVNSDWFVLKVHNPWWITYTVIYECFW